MVRYIINLMRQFTGGLPGFDIFKSRNGRHLIISTFKRSNLKRSNVILCIPEFPIHHIIIAAGFLASIIRAGLLPAGSWPCLWTSLLIH